MVLDCAFERPSQSSANLKKVQVLPKVSRSGSNPMADNDSAHCFGKTQFISKQTPFVGGLEHAGNDGGVGVLKIASFEHIFWGAFCLLS